MMIIKILHIWDNNSLNCDCTQTITNDGKTVVNNENLNIQTRLLFWNDGDVENPLNGFGSIIIDITREEDANK